MLSVGPKPWGLRGPWRPARLLECARPPMKRIWLANTDADCVVSPVWLRDQLRLARAGIEAIAGVVDVDSFAEHPQGVAEKFRATYLIVRTARIRTFMARTLGFGRILICMPVVGRT